MDEFETLDALADGESVNQDQEHDQGDETGQEEQGGDYGDDQGQEDGDGQSGDDNLEGQQDEDPRQTQRRGENRFQKLANERSEERRRNEELQRQLQERDRQFQQMLQEQERARQQAEEENLDPDERWRRQANGIIEQNRREMRQMQMQLADQSDAMAYQTKAMADPVYKRYADQVEERMSAAKRAGQLPKREDVLAYILGQEALKGRGAAAQKQRRAAGERVANAKSKPAGGTSQARPNDGGRDDDLESRLSDIEL